MNAKNHLTVINCVVLSFCAILLVYLPCTEANAGGLEVPALGTVAIGRGGAFTAKADNLSAFFYNPAGLSKSVGFNVLLGSNVLNLNVDFARSGSGRLWVDGVGGQMVDEGECPPGSICVQDPSENWGDFPESSEFTSVSSSGRFGPAPMIVLNWGDIGNVEGLAVVAGLLPPSSFGTPKYPDNGPQRYALREAHHLMIFPGAGLSYAINRYLQIGGVFLSGIALLKQSVAIRPMPGPSDLAWNEDYGGDANMELDAKDHFIPTGIIGVMSNPLDWLEVGVSVKLPAYIEAKGHLKYTAPSVDMPESYLVEGEDKVTLTQHFPWVVRSGVRYVHPRFDIELDFVWENWSSLQSFGVDNEATLNTGTGTSVMPDAKILKKFKDSYSIRLGGDVEIWRDHLTLRAGGFYQSSAYPDNNETFSVDFPFSDQVGVGGGLTWRVVKYLDVNVGYLHIFQPDVEVEQGIVQQQGLPYQDLVEGEIALGNTINSGKYQVSMNIFGLSLEGHF